MGSILGAGPPGAGRLGGPARTAADAPNPVWFKPVMFGFMLIGLAWIVVFYVSQSTLPVPSIGSWNILVGFGIMFIGFLMTTRWR
jgi:hypothetical protein